MHGQIDELRDIFKGAYTYNQNYKNHTIEILMPSDADITNITKQLGRGQYQIVGMYHVDDDHLKYYVCHNSDQREYYYSQFTLFLDMQINAARNWADRKVDGIEFDWMKSDGQ